MVFLATVVLSGLLWCTGAWAQEFDEVLVTRHNLSVGGSDSLIRDVCLVCHVEPVSSVSPQVVEALPMGMLSEEVDYGDEFSLSASPLPGLESVAAPLWDSADTTLFFLPLSEMEPLFGKEDPDKRPFGPSMGCLACHDGVIGNDIHRRGFSGGPEINRRKNSEFDGETKSSSNHPDSILYPRKPSGEFTGKQTDPNLKRYWSIADRQVEGVVIPTGPRSDYLGLAEIDPENPIQAIGLVRTLSGVIHCDTCHNPHVNLHRPFLRVPSKDLCLVCHQR